MIPIERAIPVRRLALRKSHIYIITCFLFFIPTATNFGPYSSEFGPFYLLLLLALLSVLNVVAGPKLINRQLTSISWWLGFILFGSFFIAATFGKIGPDLKLKIPMFTSLVAYLLSYGCGFLVAAQAKAMNRIIAVALIISVAVNLYEFFLSPNLFSIAPGRAAGFQVNSNASGVMLAGLWALWMKTADRRGIWMLVMGAISFLGIAVTFSRSGIIGFVVLSIVAMLTNAPMKRGRLKRFLWLLVFLTIIGFVFIGLSSQMNLSEDAMIRAGTIFRGVFDDESSIGRRDLAWMYVDLFLSHPILGLPAFTSLGDGVVQGPHNMFLALGVDFGIFGLGLFLAIIGLGVAKLARGKLHGPGGGLATVALVWLAFASIFSHNVLYSVGGSLMVGLLLGIIDRQRLAIGIGSRPSSGGRDHSQHAVAVDSMHALHRRIDGRLPGGMA